MEELYWLTRLDSIHELLGTMVGFAIMAIIAFTIVHIICDHLSECCSEEFNKKWVKISGKWLKGLIPGVILLSFVSVFTPTTKEACIIYGVGGTIDYIKQDSVATQLPHKVIVAVDKYLEEVISEENSNQATNE